MANAGIIGRSHAGVRDRIAQDLLMTTDRRRSGVVTRIGPRRDGMPTT
jgi:hypothetical protein